MNRLAVSARAAAKAAGSQGRTAGSMPLLRRRNEQLGQDQGLRSKSLKKNKILSIDSTLWHSERGQAAGNAPLLLTSWTLYTSPPLPPVYQTVTTANVLTPPSWEVLGKLLTGAGQSSACCQLQHSSRARDLRLIHSPALQELALWALPKPTSPTGSESPAAGMGLLCPCPPQSSWLSWMPKAWWTGSPCSLN